MRVGAAMNDRPNPKSQTPSKPQNSRPGLLCFDLLVTVPIQRRKGCLAFVENKTWQRRLTGIPLRGAAGETQLVLDRALLRNLHRDVLDRVRRHPPIACKP